MKNLFLLFFCSTFYTSIAQNVEALKNGNFEKWTDEYQTRPYPTDWGTSLEDDPTVKSILKIDTAHSGKHAIRLINVTTDDGNRYFGDLHLGIYTGNPQTDQYVPYPFEEKAETFKGYAKPRFARGDSASIYLSFLTHDTVVTDTIYTFTADTFNWIEFEFELPELDTVPQAMLMLFANANLNDLGSSSPNSYMDLDDLEFMGADNKKLGLANGGFENWIGEDLTYYLPNYWWTTNKLGLEKLGVAEAPVQREETAVEGDYALKLITLKETRGVAVYGNVQSLPNGSLKYSAIPYTGQPKYIKGYYKYETPANGDGNGAILYYQFRKNGKVIDEFLRKFEPDTTGEFLEFSEVILLEQEPDSLMLIVQSGDSIGSTLVLDNLYFEGEPDGVDNHYFVENYGLKASPNPYKTGDLTLDFMQEHPSSFNLYITDLTGKTVYEHTGIKAIKGANKFTFNLSNNLKSGIYICSLKSKDQIIKTKLLIE